MRLGIRSPVPARWRRTGAGQLLLSFCLLLLTVSLPPPALAQGNGERIEVGQVSLETRDDGYYFNGDFELDLKPRVAEALDRGLTLYFVVEAQLTRYRWYWFDEKAINAVLNYRLSYHALTRQYRVSTGNLQLGFPTLAEALGVMSHVRDWKVGDHGTLRAGEPYAAAVRMRLDTTQLPKPFQINAITSRDWTLESVWKRFVFEPR